MAKRSVTITETKTCSKCKDAKTLDSFSKNRAAKDGLQAWCKDCNKAYNRAKRIDLRPVNVEELTKYTTVLDMTSPDGAIWKTMDGELSQEQKEVIPGLILAFLEDRMDDSIFLEDSVCETEHDVVMLYREMLFKLFAHIRYSETYEDYKQDLRTEAMMQFM